MKVLKQLGPKCPTLEQAQDSLAASAMVTGFLFGYIDEKQLRVVGFYIDYYPNMPLCKGQERMELAFKPEHSMTEHDLLVRLMPPTKQDARSPAERYLHGGCTADTGECSLCNMPDHARKAGMQHAGIPCYPLNNKTH